MKRAGGEPPSSGYARESYRGYSQELFRGDCGGLLAMEPQEGGLPRTVQPEWTLEWSPPPLVLWKCLQPWRAARFRQCASRRKRLKAATMRLVSRQETTLGAMTIELLAWMKRVSLLLRLRATRIARRNVTNFLTDSGSQNTASSPLLAPEYAVHPGPGDSSAWERSMWTCGSYAVRQNVECVVA